MGSRASYRDSRGWPGTHGRLPVTRPGILSLRASESDQWSSTGRDKPGSLQVLVLDLDLDQPVSQIQVQDMCRSGSVRQQVCQRTNSGPAEPSL
eukprot:3089146-Rhodomonas_salina.1